MVHVPNMYKIFMLVKNKIQKSLFNFLSLKVKLNFILGKHKSYSDRYEKKREIPGITSENQTGQIFFSAKTN